MKKLKVNRAPVLTLWATIVAERLGYDHKTALTLGKAVAGLNAQAKGQRLGIFEKPKDRPLKIKKKTAKSTEEKVVVLLGRPVPTVQSAEGLVAAIKGAPIDPKSVEKYLYQKFGEDLTEVRDAMETLAKSMKPVKLASEAYGLYEKFRPAVPEGQKGWGVKGELDFSLIRSLAK
jgi:hypothetical protein